jgi:outer membrane protein assembly factor BamB
MIQCLKNLTMNTRIKSASAFVALAALLSACGGGELPPSNFPGLTVEGNTAYLASNMVVHKFDPASGKELWRFPAVGQTYAANDGRGPFAGQPVKFKDVVVVGGAITANGSADAHIYGLRDSDGAEAWRWSVPEADERGRREFADGVATDGKLLFAANGNGTLYALDASSGTPAVVWTHKAGNKLWSKPLVVDERVYQSSLDHSLYALDAATGRQLWKFTAKASLASTPAFANGTLFVGAFDSTFYAIDAATGAKKWESKVDAWVWNQAAVSNGVVFFGDTKGRFYALDAETGARNFVAELGDTVHARPVVIGDKVYAVSSNAFAFVMPVAGKGDASGVLKADLLGADGYQRRLLASPAESSGKLLLPMLDGDVKLTAVNLSDSKKAYDLLLPTLTPAPAPQ